MPRDRQGQLTLAKRIDEVLNAKPDGTTTNAETWGIPQADVAALLAQIEAADALLTTVEGPDATATIREECREAFAQLEKLMRDLHWYFSKPGFPADVLVSLGLPPHDKHPTPIPVPVTQCTGEATNPGLHLVEVVLGAYATSLTGDERARYGVRVYYGIMPPGGATVEQATGHKHYLMKPPELGDDLPNSVFTRRSKHLFDFDGDSGMTVYFCLHFENPSGEHGPFGPIFSAVIT
jgi:hypothetical protein